jgi:hypothetical protein
MQELSKTCRACGLELPIKSFYTNGRGGIRSQCGGCDRSARAAREALDPKRYADARKRTYEKAAGKRRSDARQYYKDNREKALAHSARRRSEKGPELVQKTKDWRRQLKAEMFEAYGEKCSCCGETEPRFLTLEHTRRDGAQHRLSLGGQTMVYTDLRKRGWPREGYTLLCWNCNCATRTGEPCPHQLSR